MAKTLLFSSDETSFQCSAAMTAPSGNGSLPSRKACIATSLPKLGTHLFQFVPCQVVDGDQVPLAISGRNCDAIDRRGITLSACGWPSLVLCAVDFVTYSVQTVIVAQTPETPRTCPVARSVIWTSNCPSNRTH